jgi:hypothetical protein
VVQRQQEVVQQRQELVRQRQELVRRQQEVVRGRQVPPVAAAPPPVAVAPAPADDGGLMQCEFRCWKAKWLSNARIRTASSLHRLQQSQDNEEAACLNETTARHNETATWLMAEDAARVYGQQAQAQAGQEQAGQAQAGQAGEAVLIDLAFPNVGPIGPNGPAAN